MVIDKKILDELSAKAKASERLRANLDLRNSSEDLSQRMLNALEHGTVMPIHRHKGSSETCVCIRGHFEEYFYDENGNLTETRCCAEYRERTVAQLEVSGIWDNFAGSKRWRIQAIGS